MKSKKSIFFLWVAGVLFSCNNGTGKPDASGTFEAEETVISAEAAGVIKKFDIEEGQELKPGVVVGYVDSVQLYLRKRQLVAQIGAILSKKPDISSQIAVLEEQLRIAQREQKRIENLVKADAATTKQLDDVNAQVDVLQKQIVAQRTLLGNTSTGIGEETNPVLLQIAQLNDQLMKCRIVNPVNGTVLAKYAREYELAAPGKALYKIADLSTLTLRAFVTGDQLSRIKLGQKVKVDVDAGSGSYKEHEGTISWISDKAEFTPKTIQTKDERANLVYAIKVIVKNDGLLKIGMYGEIYF